MNKEESFGIIITCYIGDYFLTKGLLASIHRFMPHIPICIIQDGDFSIEAELKAYNIKHVIKKADVKNDFLRENSFGSRRTSMIAFWESPFDRFLYLDSDTIVWGDILKNIDYMSYDFIHNIPHEVYTDFVIKQQYFNFDRLFSHVTPIDFRKHHFFNSGVFIARKGIFDIELYKKLYDLSKSNLKLFGPATIPQGLINYMVFYLLEACEIKVHELPLQTIVPIFDALELEKRFSLKVEITNPTIIHWAGKKPLYLNRKKVFSKTALYFRKHHLKDIGSAAILFGSLFFMLQEYKNLLRIHFQGSLFTYIRSKCKQIYVLKLRHLLNRIRWKLFPKNQAERLKTIKKIKLQNKYPQVETLDTTIEKIVLEHKSIARFGDGEFNLCYDRNIAFQQKNLQLRYRLKSILGFVGNNHCLIAVPNFNPEDVTPFWIDSWYENIQDYQELLNPKLMYSNAGITRQSNLNQILALSKAWENRYVIFVYGEKGRFVMNHPLFSAIKGYSEILAPAQNAWSVYDKTQIEVINEASKHDNPLVIISLGPTASVLAYDLSNMGIQSLDIGHITNVYDKLMGSGIKPEEIPIE